MLPSLIFDCHSERFVIKQQKLFWKLGNEKKKTSKKHKQSPNILIRLDTFLYIWIMNQKVKQELGKLTRTLFNNCRSWFTAFYPSHGAQLSLMDCLWKESFFWAEQQRKKFLKLTGANFKTEGDNKALKLKGITNCTFTGMILLSLLHFSVSLLNCFYLLLLSPSFRR